MSECSPHGTTERESYFCKRVKSKVLPNAESGDLLACAIQPVIVMPLQ